MDSKYKVLSDFCVLNESSQNRLSQFERLTFQPGEDLERALEWIAKQISGFKFKHRISGYNLQKTLQAVAVYSNIKTNDFYIPPSDPIGVCETPVHGLIDGQIIDISFRSQYEPFDKSIKVNFDDPNQIVHVRHWCHNEPPTATVIALHGWTMGDQRLNALAFMPGFFYQLGMNVALVELPYHGRRTVKGSGDFFPSADIAQTNEGIGQIISDLRALRKIINLKNNAPVGVMGMSLGGYGASLWATLDELAFVIPIVPLVSISDMIWEILKETEGIDLGGLSINELAGAYKIHSPLNRKQLVTKERIFIVAGLGDEIIPPAQFHNLWEHWDRPEIFWLSGGHSASFKKGEVFYKINSFLYELGLAKATNYCTLKA